jgi:hypothetical protein
LNLIIITGRNRPLEEPKLWYFLSAFDDDDDDDDDDVDK